ncbi:hypothetical protein [Formosimonas limnophila]|uniref:hypothetical protein n=1 Tax=Formosimonas limnophila TaxID=1384487 RepID=UPI001673441D|nr:hypothetical protein [Formosimonas limnophila]
MEYIGGHASTRTEQRACDRSVGIGWRIGQSLNDMGIETVGDFTRASTTMIRQRFGVVVERTQRELQGVSCLEMKAVKPKRQQIIRSRSFG